MCPGRNSNKADANPLDEEAVDPVEAAAAGEDEEDLGQVLAESSGSDDEDDDNDADAGELYPGEAAQLANIAYLQAEEAGLAQMVAAAEEDVKSLVS